MRLHPDQQDNHPYPYALWPGYRRRYRGKKPQNGMSQICRRLVPRGWYRRFITPAEGGYINFTAVMRKRWPRGRATERSDADEGVRRLYDSQGGRCSYCGTALNGDFRVDYKTPLSRGGTDRQDNLCCACEVCSRQKGTRTADEYTAYLRTFRRRP